MSDKMGTKREAEALPSHSSARLSASISLLFRRREILVFGRLRLAITAFFALLAPKRFASISLAVSITGLRLWGESARKYE